MIDSLVYITGNDIKFNIASGVFKDTGFVLLQKKLDTPEIQSKSVQDIATYSAIWASKELNQPVIVTDAGFYIEALNGFPGPFIKYVNQWFSADDYINLMQHKTNRTIIVQDCLAYCKPNEQPVVFTGTYHGTLATEPGKKSTTPIEQVYIPEGYDIPISELPTDEMLSYWSNSEILTQLKKYLLVQK